MKVEPLYNNLKYIVSWFDSGAVSCKYICCKPKLVSGYSEVASGQTESSLCSGVSLARLLSRDENLPRTFQVSQDLTQIPLNLVSAFSFLFFFFFNFCWKTLKWGKNAHKLFNTKRTLLCITSASEEAPQEMYNNEVRVLKTATPKHTGGERFPFFP